MIFKALIIVNSSRTIKAHASHIRWGKVVEYYRKTPKC